MPEKKYYWLKLKRDFFKRHDIRVVESMPNGKDYILFYLKLLLESIDHEGSLRFSETIPYNENMLSAITNTNIDVVRSAMQVFCELKMIEVLDDKTIYMNECTKLIGCETSVAERVRKHRENKNKIDQKSLTSAKTNAERQRNFRAKKSCEEKQHIPFIEDYINNKRYGGNYYVVIKRDRYECAICGSIENICVHHIDGYDESKPENSNENKMITLCRGCHSQVHAGVEIPKNILDSIDYYEKSNEMLPCNADVTVTKRFCNTEKEKEKDILTTTTNTRAHAREEENGNLTVSVEKSVENPVENVENANFSGKQMSKAVESNGIPTLDEVRAYFAEKQIDGSPEKFYDYNKRKNAYFKRWKDYADTWGVLERREAQSGGFQVKKAKQKEVGFDVDEFFDANLQRGLDIANEVLKKKKEESKNV